MSILQKNIYIYLLLGIAFLSSCSEEFQKLEPDPTDSFFKLHGGAYDQQGIDLLEFGEGFLLLGNTNTPTAGNRSELYLVETDDLGNQLTSVVIPVDIPDVDGFAHAMTPTSDDGFLISGTAVYEDESTDAWVVKINGNYEVEWNYVFGNEDSDESASAIVEDEEGAIYVLGTTTEVDQIKGSTSPGTIDSSDLYLFKLEPNGQNVIWTKSYGYTGADQGADLLYLEGGQLVLLGTTDYPENGILDKDILLMLVNGDGNPFNTQTFGEANVDEIASKFSFTEDGLAITGSSGSHVLFLHIDLELGVYAGPVQIQTTRFTRGFDIKPIPDGSGDFMITGTGDTEDNAKEDILLLQVDREGNDLRGPKFIGNQRNDAGGSLVLQDDKLIMIGTTQYLSNTMMTLLKFPIEGDL